MLINGVDAPPPTSVTEFVVFVAATGAYVVFGVVVESEAITLPFESNVTVLPFVIPVAGMVFTLPSVPSTEAVFVIGSTPITTPVGVGVAAGAFVFAAGDVCVASIGLAAVFDVKLEEVGNGPTCSCGVVLGPVLALGGGIIADGA